MGKGEAGLSTLESEPISMQTRPVVFIIHVSSFRVSCLVLRDGKGKLRENFLDGDADNLEPRAVGGGGALQQRVGLGLVLLVQGKVGLLDLPLEGLEELGGLLLRTAMYTTSGSGPSHIFAQVRSPERYHVPPQGHSQAHAVY